KNGLDPWRVYSAFTGYEPSIDCLCLQLMELLVARDKLPKSGPEYINKRRNSISDTTINYIASTMLKAYYDRGGNAKLPGALVVLLRHQLCGPNSDLEAKGRSRMR